jgi:lipoprotein-releasing system ATP-binding protein
MKNQNIQFFNINALSKSYHETGADLKILDNLNFSMNSGEFCTIVGSSGAGKSTFLHLVGGLDKPDSGTIHFNGQNIYEFNSSQLDAYRSQHIGFIFQFHHLLPELTALENIQLPAQILSQLSKSEVLDRSQKLLQSVGLENRAKHLPSELSGGERQRIAVARALMNQPSLILADEPSGNLDVYNSEKLHDLFAQLNSEMNVAFLMVTHDLHLAEKSDRQFEMKSGQLHEIFK